MFQRIRKIWALSKKDLSKLTPEQIKDLPTATAPNAVFLGEGTAEEFEEQVKKDAGTDKWYKRIRNL